MVVVGDMTGGLCHLHSENATWRLEAARAHLADGRHTDVAQIQGINGLQFHPLLEPPAFRVYSSNRKGTGWLGNVEWGGKDTGRERGDPGYSQGPEAWNGQMQGGKCPRAVTHLLEQVGNSITVDLPERGVVSHVAPPLFGEVAQGVRERRALKAANRAISMPFPEKWGLPAHALICISRPA